MATKAGIGPRSGTLRAPMGAQLPASPRPSQDWFTSDQQRHLVAHRMSNLPIIAVLAERTAHRNVRMNTQCLLCDNGPETTRHLWECLVQSYAWRRSSTAHCLHAVRQRTRPIWPFPKRLLQQAQRDKEVIVSLCNSSDLCGMCMKFAHRLECERTASVPLTRLESRP